MVEQLPAAVSALRIKHDHFNHKIELYFIHQLKSLTPIRMTIFLLYLLQSFQQIVILYATLLQSNDLYHFFELINLILSFAKSQPCDEIMENASQCPNIHSFPITFRPKQQLRRSKIQRPDHIGHLLSHKIQLLRHSIVNDLDIVIVRIDICRVRLRDKVTFFGYKHNVGRLQISVNDVITMKFFYPFQDLLKNLLYCELFLTHYYLIQVCRQPLHHHHWLIFTNKSVDHSYQVFSTQNLEDITLPDETNGQANFIQ